MFSSTLQELLTFFRNPQEHISKSEPLSAKVKTLVTTYLIFLVPVFLSTSFFILAEYLGVVSEDDHKLTDMLGDTHIAVIFLLVVLMAPFWEELFFRLPLKWNRAYIFKLLLSPFYLGGKKAYQRRLAQFYLWWKKHYGVIFYFTVVAFGLIHIANFRDLGSIWQVLLWGPLLVMPQLVLGCLLGFIRLRLGFWWAVALHATHNFIFVGIALLAQAAETANM
ncbi:MAG: CPBP family intramembrane glutamic endopeptidase [Bacteroidota bacterium]